MNSFERFNFHTVRGILANSESFDLSKTRLRRLTKIRRRKNSRWRWRREDLVKGVIHVTRRFSEWECISSLRRLSLSLMGWLRKPAFKSLDLFFSRTFRSLLFSNGQMRKRRKSNEMQRRCSRIESGEKAGTLWEIHVNNGMIQARESTESLVYRNNISLRAPGIKRNG